MKNKKTLDIYFYHIYNYFIGCRQQPNKPNNKNLVIIESLDKQTKEKMTHSEKAAREAITEYNASFIAGGEMPYPMWAHNFLRALKFIKPI